MRREEFCYYYGPEAEQFSFYRIPKLLITDERFQSLSRDAVLLYGLMLDRMSLSIKNGWFDDKNRAYIIYTIENIRADLGRGCSKEKAVKILAELDSNKGIGLIERIRRGLGKPDIIYVKNFASTVTEESPKEADSEGCNPANADVSTEVGFSDFKKSEKPTSGSRKNRPTEVRKADPNYTDNNNTELNYLNPIPINQANLLFTGKETCRGDPEEIDDAKVLMDAIRQNIDYNSQLEALEGQNRERYRELYELICDTVCVKRETVRINGVEYPYELVRSRFLSLNSSHLEYVMNSLNKTSTKISRIRLYLLTALFNAPMTMINSINQEVQHDMFGGGWQEKGIL